MSNKHKKSGSLPSFVPLFTATMDAPAWRAMSHGARNLFIALRRRWNNKTHNNGHLFLSQRDASRELGSNRTYIARWYRELQHYGFAVMTSPGSLGVDGRGKAPHWRLTDIGTRDAWPTREFERWDGKKFSERGPTKKQNPGPQTGATVDHKLVPVVDHKLVPVNSPSGPQTGAICEREGGPQTGAITSLPLSSEPPATPLSASPYLVASIARKDGRALRPPNRAQASTPVRRHGNVR